MKVLHACYVLHCYDNSKNTIQYNTYLIDRSPQGLFMANLNTTKRQNRTTTTAAKNLNLTEANHLAFYRCSWEVEPGTTRIKFNEWSERVLDPGSPNLKRSALSTEPHCLIPHVHVPHPLSHSTCAVHA